MAREIERKFLVDRESCPLPTEGCVIRQGYIPTAGAATVRVRVMGDRAFLTLKGETRGLVRSEFEYRIPLRDAEEMLAELCAGRVIEKSRYRIQHADHVWEVDVFSGESRGLWLAEVELRDELEAVALPPWVTAEVTGDPRYYNASLLDFPYSKWKTG